jgi:hypothetical protein
MRGVLCVVLRLERQQKSALLVSILRVSELESFEQGVFRQEFSHGIFYAEFDVRTATTLFVP